jgi:exopolyphosphatase/guanosine-5'-triphosphate,3'-diphosphate pyrophosphatase
VVDIGGGSTEFVRGITAPEAAKSVDVGCVRMTERHLRSDPPTAAEISAAQFDIEAAIDLAATEVDLSNIGTLIGVAGTVTTVSAINLGLPEYDSAAIHGSVIPADAVRSISADLLSMTHAERAAIPVMHPGRVDVIGAGALILRCIVDRVGASEVVVSETDILDGICWSQVLDQE